MRLRLDDLLIRLRSRLALAAALGRRLAARSAKADIVLALITMADRVEAALRLFSHLLRHALPRSGLGVTGALAWRSAAALCSVGLTAILITGLSAKDEDPEQLSRQALPTDAGAAGRPRLAAATEWVPVAHPIATFSLEAAELGREARMLEARRRQDGSEREDLMSFGGFAETGPHLALFLRTGATAAASPASFTVALIHQAARRGLAVERSSNPAPIDTRFGALETADVVLGDGTASRSCVAFRSPPGEASFAMSGWWCASPKPSDRRQLTCLVDRLDLANAAADPELRAAFARSELKRQPGCTPPRLSATGRKVSWLDVDGNLPAMRMKTASSEPTKAAAEPRKRRGKPDRAL
ncbi:hypothetical protein [Bosea thiooxidans]